MINLKPLVCLDKGLFICINENLLIQTNPSSSSSSSAAAQNNTFLYDYK